MAFFITADSSAASPELSMRNQAFFPGASQTYCMLGSQVWTNMRSGALQFFEERAPHCGKLLRQHRATCGLDARPALDRLKYLCDSHQHAEVLLELAAHGDVMVERDQAFARRRYELHVR